MANACRDVECKIDMTILFVCFIFFLCLNFLLLYCYYTTLCHVGLWYRDACKCLHGIGICVWFYPNKLMMMILQSLRHDTHFAICRLCLHIVCTQAPTSQLAAKSQFTPSHNGRQRIREDMIHNAQRLWIVVNI